jgi:hypothetical protein
MFGSIARVRTQLEEVARGFDPGAVSGDEALRLVAELGVVRRLTDGLLAKAGKRVFDTSAHAAGGDRDAAQCYARTVGVDAGEARRAIDNAAKLEALPATDAAVRAGKLSARQAQMIADAAVLNPGAERALIAAAAEGAVPLKDACVAARAQIEDPDARSARQYAARTLQTWTADDGMVEGRFKLTPEVGGRLKAAVDAETQRIFRSRRVQGPHESPDRYAADGLANLVLGDDATVKGTSVTVHVVIDHAALVRGVALEGESCVIPGVGPVSVAWALQLLGDAFLTAVVKKGRDITTVAHFGRHVPAELRTAMIVGGRECDVDGCHCRGYLERDHCKVDFAKGGPAAWWNLAWLCAVHHRRKTKGWTLGRRDPQSGKRKLRPPNANRHAA